MLHDSCRLDIGMETCIDRLIGSCLMDIRGLS